jgi:hypothetical protein
VPTKKVRDVCLCPRNLRVFFRGCALSVIRPAFLLTHPTLPFVGRFVTVLSPSTWFLSLTGVNVYSLLPYLVLGNKLQGGEIGPSCAPIGVGYAASCIWTSENSPSTHLAA